jgi:hypothetical protein
MIGLGALFASVTGRGNPTLGGAVSLAIVASIVAILVALVMRNRRSIAATRINDTHTWLKGVHPHAMEIVAGETQFSNHRPPRTMTPVGVA